MTSDPASARLRVFTQDQTDAGWRSMSLLARFIQRGGHPAPVAPTIKLRSSEKQYGAFLTDLLTYQSDGVFTGGGIFWRGAATSAEPGWEHRGRHAATITNQRLIIEADDHRADYDFRDLIMVQPNPLEWSVNLYFQGHPPLMLSGPWVPWMTVVMCAELYGSPWPPGSDTPVTAMCDNTGQG
ncbi:hypothetical protein [Actinoplanes sp. N902-109]|uniref:hypothetical protein n=1 Tax=Actinoplanes sp. (strain N902-109) TaxID=649831 RepID=UPI0003295EA6|nr:hypothetical protein [Actinoplanes sp. N902-109]AGL13690.1 hypothetical protein L083_0180 [Actinoplanes sp. N902-109]